MGKKLANIDAPQKSALVGNAGFTHAKQGVGNKTGLGTYSGGRGVGGAEHHKGSTFGGKADCIRGHKNPLLPGGQSIK